MITKTYWLPNYASASEYTNFLTLRYMKTIFLPKESAKWQTTACPHRTTPPAPTAATQLTTPRSLSRRRLRTCGPCSITRQGRSSFLSWIRGSRGPRRARGRLRRGMMGKCSMRDLLVAVRLITRARCWRVSPVLWVEGSRWARILLRGLIIIVAPSTPSTPKTSRARTTTRTQSTKSTRRRMIGPGTVRMRMASRRSGKVIRSVEV